MMSIDAILLYGSRARGDGGRLSDIDLLGVIDSGEIEKPYDAGGVSLHLYPMSWLTEQSRHGTLFLLHIVNEAVAINDPRCLLNKLRLSFVKKTNYVKELELGCSIVKAVLALDDTLISKNLIRRYFWGLRTALMAAAADDDKSIFSAAALENHFKIDGLSTHIQNRSDATADACKHMGFKVYKRLTGRLPDLDPTAVKENLSFIFNLGGVATATAGEIIYDIDSER